MPTVTLQPFIKIAAKVETFALRLQIFFKQNYYQRLIDNIIPLPFNNLSRYFVLLDVSYPMRIILFLIIQILFITQIYAAELVWKVEHPFRFMRFGSDLKIHEMAFESAQKLPTFKAAPVSTMEALLNNPKWWSTPNEGNGDQRSPFEEVEKLRLKQEVMVERGRSELKDVSPSNLRLGWSAMLRNAAGGKPSDGTCWNIVKQTYSGCSSEVSGMDGSATAYVMPKFHYVSVFIQQPPSGTCRFTLGMESGGKLPSGALILLENSNRGNTDITADFACTKSSIRLKLPYKPENKTSTSAYRYSLSAQTLAESNEPDGNENLTTTIEVKDFVIVAIGDSFSSGEGNPDVPAILDTAHFQQPAFDTDKTRNREYGFPRRKGSNQRIANDSAAYWIDRRCHRSMYGAPTRAALALSFAGSRHHAITYINFSCSGAEVTDGLLWPQDGQECIPNRTGNSFRFMEPQISGVVRTLGLGRGTNVRFGNRESLSKTDRFRKYDLKKNTTFLRWKKGFCDNWPGQRGVGYRDFLPLLHRASLQREIDLLFMTIGGNDIGFAPLIASATLNNFSELKLANKILSKIAREAADGIDIDTAKKRLGDSLPERLEFLALALQQKLEIPKNSKRVIVAGYPSLVKLGANKYCGPGDGARDNLGMSVSPFFAFNPRDGLGGKIDAEDAQHVIEDLNKVMKSAAHKHRWQFLDAYLSKFDGHAVCARESGAPASDKAEIFEVPRKKVSSSASPWKTESEIAFNPATQFRAYAKRQRWFRTYNDAFMAVQVFKGSANSELVDQRRGRLSAGAYNALRALGGPFHPTAEGHAAVADAYVKAGMKRLGLKWLQ